MKGSIRCCGPAASRLGMTAGWVPATGFRKPWILRGSPFLRGINGNMGQQIGRAQKSSLSDICRLRGPPVWNRGVSPVVTPSTGVLASIAVEMPNKLFRDKGGPKVPSEPEGSAKLDD